MFIRREFFHLSFLKKNPLNKFNTRVLFRKQFCITGNCGFNNYKYTSMKKNVENNTDLQKLLPQNEVSSNSAT